MSIHFGKPPNFDQSGSLVRAEASPPDLVTIPNVPLVKTGTYHLSTGDCTFTEDDLIAAASAVEDPGIRNPILKFGHDAVQLTQQPAVGRVTNLRYDASVQTLFGDFTGVPRKLADILHVAYPDRSIEGTFGFESQTGNTHRFALSAVSLLGEDAPGVDTLEDLYDLFYDDSQGETVAAEVAVLIQGGQLTEKKKVAATVEVEDVKRQYYEGLGPDQMWWWIRTIRLDPNELIVDNDEGELFRVPFEVGDDEVTFGEASPVKVVYEDVAATSEAGQELVFASRAESRPDSNEEGEDNVDLATLRESLGVSDDVSDEDVIRMAGEKIAEDAEGATEEETTADEPTAESGETTEEDATQLELPEGTALVDKSQLEELTTAAKAGADARAEQVKAKRDDYLKAAVKAGKFPPARLEHFQTLYDADEASARSVIDALASGIVPVNEIGTSAGDSADGADAYPEHWLPEVAARKAELENPNVRTFQAGD